MEKHQLVPHPAHPPLCVSRVTASILSHDANWLCLRWKVEGAEKLIIPPFRQRGRADGLWLTTCFELFLKQPDHAGYCEFNLSPSTRWAAYDFREYRGEAAERSISREPTCTLRRGRSMAIFDGCIATSSLPPLPRDMEIAAVIEEEGGVKSYWALAHEKAEPDFHDPACFTATLPAPE